MINILSNIYNKFKIKIFLGFFWVLCFASLNLNPEEVAKMSSAQVFRITIPLFFIIFYFCYNFKSKIIFFHNDKLFNFYPFIFYILFASSFIFLSKNINSYLNIYWGILMLGPFFYIYFFKNKLNLLKNFLFLSLLLLFFLFTYYLVKIINISILNNKIISLYGLTEYGDFKITDNSINPPRSSGLSRISIILYISLAIYLILNKAKNYLEAGIFLLSIIVGGVGLAFQSRTMNFIFLFFSILLILIYFKKKKLVNRRYILFLVIMPIILTNIYYHFLNNQISEKNFNLSEISKSISLKNVIREKKEDFSSNRFELWSKTIEISKNNFFIGYGFQADRKLIKDSVHNVYLYSLICGGVISLLLIIFISLRSAWVSSIILFNFIFLKKNYNSLDLIPAFLIPLFLLRGMLETSYAIYSIDYLFFIICFFINEINFKKNYLYKTLTLFRLTLLNK